MNRRQSDDQRGDHAIEFFPVAVGQKETAWLVEQQFVEMGFEFLFLQTQIGLCRADGLGHDAGPFVVCQCDLIGVDFPDAPDVGVDKCFGSFAVGRLPRSMFLSAVA